MHENGCRGMKSVPMLFFLLLQTFFTSPEYDCALFYVSVACSFKFYFSILVLVKLSEWVEHDVGFEEARTILDLSYAAERKKPSLK